ncbi:hypothetical protein ABMY37_20830 [Vibrio vulnificus]|uniref:hypothetical protein n=1 Tax=Vibrio vulnificus TaxID=672 RepID=UPI00405826D0
MSDWVKEKRETIRSSLWTTLPIIFLAVSIPLIALFCPTLMLKNETVATWFQRSGAIVVALAVWIEIKNNAISGYIYPSGFSTSDFVILKQDYGLYFNLIKWTGFLLAIIGTLIWGYGDIPLRNT